MTSPDTATDEGHLRIERVTTGRRGPLAAALVALAVVGLLLWKPWDRPTPTPSQLPIAAVPTPTASQSLSPAPPTPVPTAAPTPTLPPRTPSPTTAPLKIVDVRYAANNGAAFVQCHYAPAGDGQRVLSQLDIGPPYIELHPLVAALQDLRRVSWRVKLESNLLETTFSANWEPISESRRQFAPDLTGDPLALKPLHIDSTDFPQGPTLVLRVVVVVEWFGPQRVLLGSSEIVVASYAHGESGPVLAEGCHTYTD